MIYITGDTHGDFSRFSTKHFPQQKELTADDFVIICGDFGGVWDQEETPAEKHNLDWLESKKFTLLFCDGNHENFDRLKKYPIVRFHGGNAHRIRDNIYHLMRGYVYDFDGKRIFVFGGAKSHDIKDGILNPADYSDRRSLMTAYRWHQLCGHYVRINHLSWWKEELPSSQERKRGIRSLERAGYNVDYIVSHCFPLSMEQLMYKDCKPNSITKYFDEILEHGICFHRWYCGHYHRNQDLNSKMRILYEKIIPLE